MTAYVHASCTSVANQTNQKHLPQKDKQLDKPRFCDLSCQGILFKIQRSSSSETLDDEINFRTIEPLHRENH